MIKKATYSIIVFIVFASSLYLLFQIHLIAFASDSVERCAHTMEFDENVIEPEFVIVDSEFEDMEPDQASSDSTSEEETETFNIEEDYNFDSVDNEIEEDINNSSSEDENSDDYYQEPEVVEDSEPELEEEAIQYSCIYTGSQFKSMGVINQNGYRYTWYSSKKAHHYRTDEWWLDENNIYRDSDGYVVVASSDHSQGSIVTTPFGDGKVYDCGCEPGTIDIYVCF